jgi:hypothetical protein
MARVRGRGWGPVEVGAHVRRLHAWSCVVADRGEEAACKVAVNRAAQLGWVGLAQALPSSTTSLTETKTRTAITTTLARGARLYRGVPCRAIQWAQGMDSSKKIMTFSSTCLDKPYLLHAHGSSSSAHSAPAYVSTWAFSGSGFWTDINSRTCATSLLVFVQGLIHKKNLRQLNWWLTHFAQRSSTVSKQRSVKYASIHHPPTLRPRPAHVSDLTTLLISDICPT